MELCRSLFGLKGIFSSLSQTLNSPSHAYTLRLAMILSHRASYQGPQCIHVFRVGWSKHAIDQHMQKTRAEGLHFRQSIILTPTHFQDYAIEIAKQGQVWEWEVDFITPVNPATKDKDEKYGIRTRHDKDGQIG